MAKYSLVKVCTGTESFVNSMFEMDEQDVYGYEVIPSDKKDEYDYVRVISESDNKEQLLEYMQEYIEEESFSSYYY